MKAVKFSWGATFLKERVQLVAWRYDQENLFL
jgi:hypothetical protein